MLEEKNAIESLPSDVTHGETRRGRELLGLPVYTIAEGKHLGEIDGLLVRRDDCSIQVVRVRQSLSGKRGFVPFTALKTVGVDTALVDTLDSLHDAIPPANGDGLEMDLPGRPVITQSGENVGKLAGFAVDSLSGRITLFRVEANTGFLGSFAALWQDKTVEVPITLVTSLGPDAVIVQDAVKELLKPTPPPAASATPAA